MEPENRHKPAKLYFEKHIPDNFNASLLPIVFIHGFCSLHNTWSTVWKKIAYGTKRKVIILDTRNHGKSEWNDSYSLELLRTDLENFLIENGIKKCVLVGHSLGGRTSMYLALTKPEFVEKMVVEETAVRNGTEEEFRNIKTLVSFLPRIRTLPKGLTEFQVRNILSTLVAEKFNGPVYKNIAFQLPIRKEPEGGFGFNFNVPPLEKSFQDPKSSYDIDFKVCRKFSGPVLFIFAEESETKVEEDESVLEYFPQAELCKFNSKSHLLHIECFQEYIEKVTKFINTESC